ncbi:MAG: class I SAM-dependent methyltransferase [Burkholderiales bacterium]
MNLAVIERYAPELEAIGSEPPPAPRWNQDWFPRLDAAAAYAMVREAKPRRIVEVGSGHSTRFLARAVEDGGLGTRITAIDPRPRAAIRGLDAVQWLQTHVETLGRRPFDALGANDILFVDSSHQLKPGGDVDFLLNEVIPRLSPGVRVHFHDIFLPDDYPKQWAWRRYDEQQAVGALIDKGVFTVDFASHSIVKQKEIGGVLARLPLVPGAVESSLWLTKN